MTYPVDTQILIVGGGIGGLTLAAICKRLSISCRVLERTETLRPAGAGISLAPNALRVLDQLGLYDEIQRSGQKLKKILITRDKSRWHDLDWTLCESTYGYPVYSIERHHFHGILYEAAGGADTVEMNSKVQDIIDEPSDPYVRVKLADGREMKSLMVVGADGIRSVTRRILARKAGFKEANTIRFTGRVHMSGITAPMKNLGPSELGVANWLFYDDAILTTWPCQDNRQWFIGVKQADANMRKDMDRSVWATTTPEMIKDVYGEKFHPFAENEKFEDIVDNAERILASNVFEEVEFPSMASGRVALLGDAAHSMTSFFGQGACQAIEDATELANLLQENLIFGADVKNGINVSKVLNDYCSRREPRARALVSFSANYARMHTANLPYGLGPLVRRLVYTYMPPWAWMWYLGWLYGYQPTVNGLSHSA